VPRDIAFSAALTLSAGTANGVPYLNASKVLTTGSALTFDGSRFSVIGSGTLEVAQFGTSTNNTPSIGIYSDGSIRAKLRASSAETALLTQGNLPLLFGVNDTEKMRLESATGGVGALGIGYSTLTSVGDSGLAVLGKVGIGTDAPTTKLYVTASVASTAIAGFFNTDTANGNGVYIKAGGANAGKYALAVDNAASASLLYLESSGNLGIGTTPSNRLHVVYGGSTVGAQFTASAGYAQMQLTAAGSNQSAYYTFNVNGTGKGIVQVNAVDALTLDSSGNVSVGTSSVNAKLNVVTALSGTYGSAGIWLSDNSTTSMLMNNTASGVSSIWASGALTFGSGGNNNTERARIDASGNLGLGVTPSPWGGAKAFEAGLVGNYFIGSTAASYTSIGTASYYNGSNWVYARSTAASKYELLNDTHAWYIAPSGTANTTTITNGVSYTIITSGNQTAFGAANNNVGTSFTATSSGTLSSGTVSQNISFTQAMTLANNGTLLLGTTTDSLASAGNFTLGSSKPGGETDALVYNPSNTAASRARVWISNGGTSAGSANLLFTSGLAGTRLVMGVDSTDGDKFKIGNGYSVGSGTTYVLLDTSGNLLLGGTVSPASATKSFSLFNGTVPTGSVTDGCVLYTEDVSSSSELKVRDEAGNVTTLSPHNFDLIPEGPSEEMAWSYYSERDGKRINVDMLKAIRLLEKLSGEKLVHFA
jgi:hypothetical protein